MMDHKQAVSKGQNGVNRMFFFSAATTAPYLSDFNINFNFMWHWEAFRREPQEC